LGGATVRNPEIVKRGSHHGRERVLWVRGTGEEEEEKEEGATVSVKELQSFTNTDIQSHGAYDKCSSDGVLGSFHNLLGCRS
jgi:hypothetical protein